jgi:hypothetical protein
MMRTKPPTGTATLATETTSLREWTIAANEATTADGASRARFVREEIPT